eukprot:evm.model.NODE_5347_length_7097_cov_43.092010.3
MLCHQPGTGRVLDSSVVVVVAGADTARAIAPTAGGEGLHCFATVAVWELAWNESRGVQGGNREDCGVCSEHQDAQEEMFDVGCGLQPVWCGAWICLSAWAAVFGFS